MGHVFESSRPEMMLALNKGFPGGSNGKAFACNVGYPALIPGSGRSPGEGNGYPPQYFGLESSIDSIVHGVAESGTTERLATFTSHVT